MKTGFLVFAAALFFAVSLPLSAKENLLQAKMSEADAAETHARSTCASLVNRIDAVGKGISQIPHLDKNSIMLIADEIGEYESASLDHAKAMIDWKDKVEDAASLGFSLSREHRLSKQEKAAFLYWLGQKRKTKNDIDKPYVPPDVQKAEKILSMKNAREEAARHISLA